MTIAAERWTAVAATTGTAPLVPEPRGWLDDEESFVLAVEQTLRATLDDLVGQWQLISPPDPGWPSRLDPNCVLRLAVDFASSGGKRLRPRMVHWGWVAAGGEDTGVGRRDAVTVAAALELLHAFALVQDDVMDASDQRRGRPAVHVRARRQHERIGALGPAQRYGESIATLVGDLLHSEADALAGTLPAPLRTAWRTLSIELIAGQARDLVGAANGRRDLAHARQVAAMKSGAYTVWRPLQLGAVAAGAGPDTLAALRAFGLHLGEAFALRDDVLGATGDPAHTGKPVGDDLIEGKPTVLLSLAQRRFSPHWQSRLDRVGSASCTPGLAAELAAEMVRCGVVAEVEDMIAAAVRLGLAALAHPSIDPRGAQGLRMLADRVAWRDS